MAGGYEVERPIAQPTVTANVVVPFLQALIIGVTAGLLVTWLVVDVVGVVDSWWPISAALAGAFFGAAFLVKSSAAESTLWTVERVIGRDITGDQVVGKPTHDHIIVAGPGESNITSAERKRAQFVAFVRQIAATGDTSRERFEGTIGRARYEEFRDALLMRSDLARWRSDNHRVGWDLVGDPDEIIKGML